MAHLLNRPANSSGRSHRRQHRRGLAPKVTVYMRMRARGTFWPVIAHPIASSRRHELDRPTGILIIICIRSSSRFSQLRNGGGGGAPSPPLPRPPSLPGNDKSDRRDFSSGMTRDYAIAISIAEIIVALSDSESVDNQRLSRNESSRIERD
jgi:hypothetical protein